MRISIWDRAAILGLGAAGGILSFDALQQMAAAIHVRDNLVWLFPLVIDGFIAYSVRALVVLRDAHFAARLYVWALFSTATSTSIWANGLHAVRLNQQNPVGAGLHLGDATVGVLSTIAPLALAGAVHLYILIARRSTTDHARTVVPARTGSGPNTDDTDEALLVAQDAVQNAGRVNRRLVRSALRAQHIKISNERLGIVLQTLRDESDGSNTRSQP
nr:DUF2637 domain-containing protein [Streptomyces hainanensis]